MRELYRRARMALWSQTPARTSPGRAQSLPGSNSTPRQTRASQMRQPSRLLAVGLVLVHLPMAWPHRCSRGLPGGAEGIRTDGHRGFPAANRGISPATLKGDERQTRLRKATQPYGTATVARRCADDCRTRRSNWRSPTQPFPEPRGASPRPPLLRLSPQMLTEF